MAGLLEMLLASHMQGPRRGVFGIPEVPPEAVFSGPGGGAEPAPPAVFSGMPAAAPMALPFDMGGGLPKGAFPAAPGPSEEEIAAASQAYRGFPRLDMSRKPDVFAQGAPPVMGFGSTAPVGAAGAGSNDEEGGVVQPSGETIPMPRARPEGLGGTDFSSVPRGGQPAGPPMDIQPPMQPPGAPMALPPPPMAGGGAPAAPGGMDGIMERLRENAPLLLALGAGLSGAPSLGTGLRRAAAGAAPVSMQMQNQREARGLKTAEREAIFKQYRDAGVPANEALIAANDPIARKEIADKYFGKSTAAAAPIVKEFKNTDGTLIQKQWDASSQSWKPVVGFEQPVPGERQSVPSGYRYAADGKTLEAIAGGPAEKVDAQVAARIGLAESFLGQLPEIRKRVNAGQATGPGGAIKGALGYGDAGELRRQVASGAEALLRNLTGAGMSIPEANKYIKRYEIEALDTTDVSRINSKLNQLERELKFTLEAVKKGRGGGIRATADGLVSDDAPAAAPAKRRTGGSVTVGGRALPWGIVD